MDTKLLCLVIFACIGFCQGQGGRGYTIYHRNGSPCLTLQAQMLLHIPYKVNDKMTAMVEVEVPEAEEQRDDDNNDDRRMWVIGNCGQDEDYEVLQLKWWQPERRGDQDEVASFMWQLNFTFTRTDQEENMFNLTNAVLTYVEDEETFAYPSKANETITATLQANHLSKLTFVGYVGKCYVCGPEYEQPLELKNNAYEGLKVNISFPEGVRMKGFIPRQSNNEEEGNNNDEALECDCPEEIPEEPEEEDNNRDENEEDNWRNRCNYCYWANPTSYPPAPQNYYYLNTTDGLCIVTQMKAFFTIPYELNNGNFGQAQVQLPNRKYTRVTGVCGYKQQYMRISFFDTWNLTLSFEKSYKDNNFMGYGQSKYAYTMTNMALTYTIDNNFNNARRSTINETYTVQILGSDESELGAFKSGVGQYYSCMSQQKVQFGNDIEAEFYNMRVQAFRSDVNYDFNDDYIQCAADYVEESTGYIIAIVVGSILAVLIVVVAIACIVKRSQKRKDYEQM